MHKNTDISNAGVSKLDEVNEKFFQGSRSLNSNRIGNLPSFHNRKLLNSNNVQEVQKKNREKEKKITDMINCREMKNSIVNNILSKKTKE